MKILKKCTIRFSEEIYIILDKELKLKEFFKNYY